MEKPNDYCIKQFYWAGKTYSLICKHGKIIIPKQTQKKTNGTIMYYAIEIKPEILSFGQYIYWKGLQKSVHDLCSKCHTCQFLKRGKSSSNNLPTKQVEIQLRKRLNIDLIGKYRKTPNKGGRKYAMKRKKDKDIYLQAITMIDPTG